MTCQIWWALNEILLLHKVYQPIVDLTRGFVCARESGKLVAWQCTPVFVIETDVWGAREILYVMERPPVSSARNVHIETL